ncbi:hypothetical protein ACP4OV_003483 [Aristida adscensionis]
MGRAESSRNKCWKRIKACGAKQKSKKNRKARPEDGDDVCAICDDGGYITCCDGGCLRSFHLTDEHGQDTNCEGLGLTSEQAKMIIEMEHFVCENCKYKQHQCFACGLLGSSDWSSGPEVFQCKDDDCGHFYHPKCVTELLYSESKLQATLLEQCVAAGLKFLCPVHKCSACNGREDKGDKTMQFAVCRHCPTAYHRKCLPSEIPFETRQGPNGYMQRAWDGILRDRILIYCTKHEIVEELGIPMRKCIIFPVTQKLSKNPAGRPMDQDIPKKQEILNHPSSMEQGIPKKEELLKQPSSMEQDISKGEELLNQPSSMEQDMVPKKEPCEPSLSPPAATATDWNRRFCTHPLDTFAPMSLHMHPHPGSCGWLSD